VGMEMREVVRGEGRQGGSMVARSAHHLDGLPDTCHSRARNVALDLIARPKIMWASSWRRSSGGPGSMLGRVVQASTVNGRIMSLSSCSTMWQW
jgi:hypothetical protein